MTDKKALSRCRFRVFKQGPESCHFVHVATQCLPHPADVLFALLLAQIMPCAQRTTDASETRSAQQRARESGMNDIPRIPIPNDIRASPDCGSLLCHVLGTNLVPEDEGAINLRDRSRSCGISVDYASGLPYLVAEAA